MKPLLVTGSERSGTLYMAKLLQAIGLNARHESAFNTVAHGPIEADAEVSWLAVPYLPLEDVVVVHQIRHPLSAISSSVFRESFAGLRSYGRWAMTLDRKIRGTLLARSCKYWLRWNARAAAHATVRWRIEDVKADDIARALHLAGRTVTRETVLKAMAHMPKNVNSEGPVPQLEWADLAPPLRRRIRARARSYGYR